jgi:ParB-like chromosome segregation protein Spo0J
MNVDLHMNSKTPGKPPGLTITYQPVNRLKPDPANPRRHSRTQIRQIAKSIEAFGFNVPILVDADLNVIAGHGRLLACAELGISEAATVRLDHLTRPRLAPS